MEGTVRSTKRLWMPGTRNMTEALPLRNVMAEAGKE
jgi:hypothetical protein